MAKNDSIREAKRKAKKSVRGRLTDHEITLIAEMLESGISYEQIAEKFERVAQR